MKLEQFHWDKVSITYDAPTKRYRRGMEPAEITSETLRNVLIFFEQGGEYTTALQLRWGRDKSLMLTKAKVIKLTPWSAKFEAYWWSSKLDSTKMDTLIRADIVCEFEEEHDR